MERKRVRRSEMEPYVVAATVAVVGAGCYHKFSSLLSVASEKPTATLDPFFSDLKDTLVLKIAISPAILPGISWNFVSDAITELPKLTAY